jgi:hypothetical protein
LPKRFIRRLPVDLLLLAAARDGRAGRLSRPPGRGEPLALTIQRRPLRIMRSAKQLRREVAGLSARHRSTDCMAALHRTNLNIALRKFRVTILVGDQESKYDHV